MSQSHDLHRALLRPAIIHTLRAVGFHSTKPSVLDTLVNLAERHLQLLAATTAHHALQSHNDPIPTVSDVRLALSDCGVLVPLADAAEEGWMERLRAPLAELEAETTTTTTANNISTGGGHVRAAAEKRKREDEDTRDVRAFSRWFDGPEFREIKRVAGLLPPDAGAVGGAPAVGVGGGVVQAEDFLTVLLKKKHGKGGDDSRLAGTVLGRAGAAAAAAEEREVTVDGGPVASLREWKPPPPPPRLVERSANIVAAPVNGLGGPGADVEGKGEENGVDGMEMEGVSAAVPGEAAG